MKIGYLASSNRDKSTLVNTAIARYGWQLSPVSPGNAESDLPIGYEVAAIGKAIAGAKSVESSIPVFGLDSGYEFDCFGGWPGPLTARSLKQHKLHTVSIPLGSQVTVVQSLAIVWEGRCSVSTHRDRRVVNTHQTQEGSTLPLTTLAVGPKEALSQCVADLMKWMEQIKHIQAVADAASKED